MKIKTSELTGAALDWAVCKASGLIDAYPVVAKNFASLHKKGTTAKYIFPSTDWSQGGPIIEREGIWLRGPHDACKPDGTVVLHIDYWYAHKNHAYVQNDRDPLIAAMRCYVASKLGDEIDVPEELL